MIIYCRIIDNQQVIAVDSKQKAIDDTKLRYANDDPNDPITDEWAEGMFGQKWEWQEVELL